MNSDVSYRESYDSAILSEHATIIGVLCGLCGVLLLASMVMLAIGKKLRTAQIVVLLSGCSIVLVGLLVWFTTFGEMKSSVEKQVDLLLESRTSEVALELVKVMTVGIDVVESYSSMSEMGLSTFNSTYPTPMMATASLVQSRLNASGIAIVYYGNRYDYTIGCIINAKTGTKNLMIGAPKEWWTKPADETPFNWKCLPRRDARSDCKEDTEAKCQDPAIRLQCGKECGKTTGVYQTDLHNRSNCYDYDPEVTAWLSSVRLMPGIDHSGAIDQRNWNFVIPSPYYPSQRPWYKEGLVDYAKWTAPYVFSGGEIGITAVRGVRDTRDSTQFMGVAAVDYTIKSLYDVTSTMAPTKGATVLISTLDGILLAGSVDKEEMTPQIGLTPLGFPKHGLARVSGDSITASPRVLWAFDVVRSRFGTLQGAFDQGELLLIHQERTVVAVRRATVPGGLRTLVVVTIPYDDVMKDAEDAASTALVIALILCIACSLFVGITVTALLLPLNGLVYRMRRVAWMDLDVEDGMQYGITSEVSSMASSFLTTVQNLRMYKEYLPESVTGNQVEVEETAEEEESSKSGSKRTITATSESASTQRQRENPNLFAVEIRKRKISLVCATLEDTPAGSPNFIAEYQTYLEAVSSTARCFRGVIDSFNGDRVIASFNTVNNLGRHLAAACDTIIKLKESGQKMKIAAASGESQFGNSGAPGLKRFNIFGPVIRSVVILSESCNVVEGLPNGVVCPNMVVDIESLYKVKLLRRAKLPHTGDAYKPIAELVGSRDTEENEEWMYTLADKTDPYIVLCEAARFVYKLEFEAAEEALNRCSLPDGDKADLRARIDAKRDTKLCWSTGLATSQDDTMAK